MKQLVSLVIPCFNEEACLKECYESIKALDLQSEYELEIVFVDDGSRDNTLDVIMELAKRDASVRYISFSRNFGKESALLAGLTYANGDFIATMDADMQDPPSLLPQMLKTIKEEGYDCVATRRSTRQGEPVLRSLSARMFYWLMAHFSDVSLVDGARDYRMMTRKVVDAILSLREVNRFTKGIYQWVGFKTKWISFENVQRSSGVSKFSFLSLLKYSFDAITAFSTLPLQLASVFGLLCCVGAFVFMSYVVVKTLVFGEVVKGYPSLVCLLLFLSGIEMLLFGTLGTYISRIYQEIKHRPLYIVKTSNVQTLDNAIRTNNII